MLPMSPHGIASLVLEGPPADEIALLPGIEMCVTRRLGETSDGVVMTAFRPTSFAFDDPDDWIVREFKVGHHSQLNVVLDERGDVPRIPASRLAALLGSPGPGPASRGCQTIARGQDVSMVVVAMKPGLRFRCVMRGPCFYGAPGNPSRDPGR